MPKVFGIILVSVHVGHLFISGTAFIALMLEEYRADD